MMTRDGGGKADSWSEALCRGITPWVAAHPTSANAEGRAYVCAQIVAWLERLGFEVEHRGAAPGIIVATRVGAGRLRVGLVGHYDVEDVGAGWSHPPLEVTRAGGRVFGRGLADNLGPLWLRLTTLEAHRGPAPSLLVVLQGEEEVGSPTAHRVFPGLDLPRVDLWIEETGYFELDGSQRLLVRNLDDVTAPLVAAVEQVATTCGRASRRHDRFLNKAFGAESCPFLTHLIGGSPYLAMGPNDPGSAIHRPDESLPEQNLELSARQFHALLVAAARVTR